jgi:hypothetical protein
MRALGSGSADLACNFAYTDENGGAVPLRHALRVPSAAHRDPFAAEIKNGFVLGQGYQDFAFPVIDMQLAKGGVRLVSAPARARCFRSTTLLSSGDRLVQCPLGRRWSSSAKQQLKGRLCASVQSSRTRVGPRGHRSIPSWSRPAARRAPKDHDSARRQATSLSWCAKSPLSRA